MGEVLETIMLVCFGFSWPINVIKAYKARSTKGTSLGFILLIITGYAAGISAKILNKQTNYVLVVYFINIVIVFINLLVYFRNHSLDKEKTNMITNNNSVILFGGTNDKDIPVSEIAVDYDFNFKFYNKSSYGLSIKDAKTVYLEQIQKLAPESIIIHLGNEDLNFFKQNSAAFDVHYLELISCIQSDCKKRIALVSNYNNDSSIFEEMNRHIKAIAESEKCVYVNLDDVKTWKPETTKELMAFMYNVGFDQPLKVKKPLSDICEIIFSYAYQNGMLEFAESKAV